MAMLSIAMVGTRGVPARYGGFETAVQEIGSRLAAQGHRITVYCRNPNPDQEHPTEHMGMQLVTLPCSSVKQMETLSHTYNSIRHEIARSDRSDVAVVFNAANGPLLPLLRRAGMPVAVNTDGIEWMRGKWGRVGRSYYKMAEKLCVRWADRLIADARAIQDYYLERHGALAEFIPYGAAVLDHGRQDRLRAVGLEPGGYHLVVARLEPENNVDMIVAGYRQSRSDLPLVVVGGNPYDPEAEAALARAAEEDPRIRPFGSVWDQQLLDQLYMHSVSYLHGHSVGGTNPSLLRAMGAGARVIAFDSPFNREVLLDHGTFFDGPEGVARLLARAEEVEVSSPSGAAAEAVKERVRTAYNWDSVANAYLELCQRLVRRDARTPVTV